MNRERLMHLTAEQLNELPDFITGLPTGLGARAEALDAWRRDRWRGLNAWRASKNRDEADKDGILRSARAALLR